MSLANTDENALQMSYGELTMLKLEEFFGCSEIANAQRSNLRVPGDFWDWRKENKTRAGVLNKAGLSLDKTEKGWVADLSAVTADTLDEARDARIAWNRTEKELKERARLYMRQCDRLKYLPGGQFGRPV